MIPGPVVLAHPPERPASYTIGNHYQLLNTTGRGPGVSGIPAVDVVHNLYASHHGWLRNWLRKRLGNTFDAADLAQDTFIRIIEARRKPGAPR